MEFDNAPSSAFGSAFGIGGRTRKSKKRKNIYFLNLTLFNLYGYHPSELLHFIKLITCHL